MKVNNLCFNATDFLRLVGESEVGECVYFLNKVWMQVWRGSTRNGYHTISIVRDSLEIQSILDRFDYCPMSLGTEDNS